MAVHCRQGIGRSALIVGRVLVAAGRDVGTATEAIKKARGVDVPETKEQQQWLSDCASWMASTPAQRLDCHHAT
ncbi:MAG: hypothetical protein HYU37_12350 [Acidobacteria bacterium]|nr:hypothetical protein [Acidobacteriota bacterium]